MALCTSVGSTLPPMAVWNPTPPDPPPEPPPDPPLPPASALLAVVKASCAAAARKGAVAAGHPAKPCARVQARFAWWRRGFDLARVKIRYEDFGLGTRTGVTRVVGQKRGLGEQGSSNVSVIVLHRENLIQRNQSTKQAGGREGELAARI